MNPSARTGLRRHDERWKRPRVVLHMGISVDGFVAGPHGELDWIFETWDDELTSWEMETLWQAGVHAMGRATYLDMAAHWPSSIEPFAAPMNEVPKAVFSKTLTETPWGRGSRAT